MGLLTFYGLMLVDLALSADNGGREVTSDMRITKYGHSCLLIEEGEARILIDPGRFSSGFENLAGLDAIFITQQHQDHLIPENISGLLAKNPLAKVYADEQSATILGQQGTTVQAVHESDQFEVAGVAVEVFGRDHAVLHPQIPVIRNVGYLVAGRLFHPGDSHTVPGKPVEILALPLVAPWSNIEQTIDYALELKPKLMVPIHDAITDMPGIYEGLLESLVAPAGIKYRLLRAGESLEL